MTLQVIIRMYRRMFTSKKMSKKEFEFKQRVRSREIPMAVKTVTNPERVKSI